MFLVPEKGTFSHFPGNFSSVERGHTEASLSRFFTENLAGQQEKSIRSGSLKGKRQPKKGHQGQFFLSALKEEDAAEVPNPLQVFGTEKYQKKKTGRVKTAFRKQTFGLVDSLLKDSKS